MTDPRPPRVGTTGPRDSIEHNAEKPLTKTSRLGSNDFSVVGVGASAGGLEACRKLVAALPADSGMAFILVQHLDPTHESMMVNLLASHTKLPVLLVTDGMKIEPGHIYVIPPGTYLSIVDRALHLSAPEARHGARLPFDFLLNSMAIEFGERAICVVLSGSGADGSTGLKLIKKYGGLVVAQMPEEAGFDGMPRSAIATGLVDFVLPAVEIPAALDRPKLRGMPHGAKKMPATHGPVPRWLPDIIEHLRNKTAHDFRSYKQGTLQRRIERRMAMVAIETADGERYLELLRQDPGEVGRLVKDLLINVTRFFRDPDVFDLLAKTVFPDLIVNHNADLPFRVWIAGCSSGEEAYSMSIIIREAITAAKANLKVQIFASDVDPEAVATAREGLYPKAIEDDISPARLARFFSKEANGYRVSPDLRAGLTFTVQDLLVDPPFSRLDFVSCRNLLIYLGAEAQAKVIAMFHFALRNGGLLLLGSAETIINIEGRFEAISKPARLFRHIGHARPWNSDLLMGAGDGTRLLARQGANPSPSRQAALAELCRRQVLDAYAPAVVLINRRQEYLYSLGPINRYLRLAAGHPTRDLLAMAHDGVRNKLRSAIQQATETNARSVVANGVMANDGRSITFRIEVQPLSSDGEDLFLISFIEDLERSNRPLVVTGPGDVSRVIDLERELAATRTELQSAIRSLELSGEEQRAINEEALSVNEEFQSTNEELLTSKEELQSLNEELTALNTQLQETLERQRTTATDLQNVLYSTDVATLFLDTSLCIRFFTPAVKALFNVIATDIGRPLADLHSLSADRFLADDARAVLKVTAPIDREIETSRGTWFTRRILPYRGQDDRVEGVVITFSDVTERKRIRMALEEAKLQADRANAAKSRFLAAASHDLRQPLQTFSLLQGLLAKNVTGEKAQKLVSRLDETLSAMTGMLDALLDINRIDAGTVRAELVDFPINDLISRVQPEFLLLAQAKGLVFHVVASSSIVRGDPALLEQILRNLLSNALKFTQSGKILLGCRRRSDGVRIEICDTGIGIAASELDAIFEEYHQIDNAARERSHGLGLGLAIVQRLGKLMNAAVHVRSVPGKGSVFSIDLKLGDGGQASRESVRPVATKASAGAGQQVAKILVVEDEPEVRDLLGVFLKDEGHQAETAPSGVAALDLIMRGIIRPDLILADYNLPNNMDGLRLATKIRETLGWPIPVIILTGDISADALREIARQNCVQLNKPVKLKELTENIQHCLSVASTVQTLPERVQGEQSALPAPTVIYVVDDDDQVRNAIRLVLEDDGRIVQDFSKCEAFLAAYRPVGDACILIDAYLPGMSGLELLQRLRSDGHTLPAIMITGDSDVTIAVRAMKAGASDFIEKPIGRAELLACVDRALEQSRDVTKISAWRENAATQIAGLTARERQIMDMVLAGHPSKNIAADLAISQRTVENHRSAIMKKTGAKSLPALARLAIAAAID